MNAMAVASDDGGQPRRSDPFKGEVVGVIGTEEWQGYVVLLEQFTDEHWLLYWRNPGVPDGLVVVGRDGGDDLLGDQEQAEEFLARWEVVWLPEKESSEARNRYFNM